MMNKSYLNLWMPGLITLVLMMGCKKKEDAASQPTTQPSTTGSTTSSGSTTSLPPSVACNLYTTVSPDTNYIPHKKNNSWYYCAGGNMAGYGLTITRDTLINNLNWLSLYYYTSSSHTLSNSVVMEWFINPAGEYYQVNFWATSYRDTVLMIKPGAVNGDTIFNNSRIKVLLVNDNETVETIPGCYHVREVYPTRIQDHYYKKGLGELYFNGFFKMSSALIQ